MANAGSTASRIEWRLELVQVPVSDVDRAKAFYVDRVGFIAEASEVQEFPWGRFVFFADPDGNGWAVQEIVQPQD